ncbi:MAG: hypothetical protein K8J31_06480, partial [Anaerolineae bacterium]|nr:hypothetical protein [Anaerolineae bacterium]
MPTTMRMMFPTIWKIMWVLMALYASASLLIVTAGGRLLYHPGDVIALTSILPRNDLFILDVPRRILRNLTHSAAIERGLRWSPDGEQLAYISDLYEIRTLPFMGKQTNRITIGTAYIRSLAWSLDGTRIFFTASDSGPVQLRSMSAKGEDVQAVPNLPLDYHDLTWSPDGQLLAFASLHEGDHAIYIMDWSSGE